MYIERGFGIFGSGSPLASVWLLRNLGRLQLFAYYYDFFFLLILVGFQKWKICPD